VLFANQQALDDGSLKVHAAGIGLDTAAFEVCLDTSRYSDRVRAGMDMGMAFGVNSTPTVFINGRAVSGAQPYDVFAAIIDEELARSAR
jgi:predicted DsbA family dithiol-disulfide isomerase